MNTIEELSSGTENAKSHSSVISSIVNAQQLSDKGRYLKSNFILQQLQTSISENNAILCDVSGGTMYGLMRSNYFKIGDSGQVHVYGITSM
jgi:hypothetical protein